MPFKTYTPTKANQARAICAQLKADGKPIQPKTVLALLARRGIEMDPGQCSVITREFRKRARRASKRQAAPKTPAVSNGKCSTNGQGQVVLKDYATLLLATQFAKNCGGVARAKKALVELASIVEPVTKS